MKPHPRIRRFFKWGGLAACVLLVGLWCWNLRWYSVSGMWRGWACSCVSGCVYVWHVQRQDLRDEHAGPYCERYDLRPVWTPQWLNAYRATGVRLPLWIPLAGSLASTLLAWRLDARARRRGNLGLCPACSYPRAGLGPGATCPECGRPHAI